MSITSKSGRCRPVGCIHGIEYRPVTRHAGWEGAILNTEFPATGTHSWNAVSTLDLALRKSVFESISRGLWVLETETALLLASRGAVFGSQIPLTRAQSHLIVSNRTPIFSKGRRFSARFVTKTHPTDPACPYPKTTVGKRNLPACQCLCLSKAHFPWIVSPLYEESPRFGARRVASLCYR